MDADRPIKPSNTQVHWNLNNVGETDITLVITFSEILRSVIANGEGVPEH